MINSKIYKKFIKFLAVVILGHKSWYGTCWYDPTQHPLFQITRDTLKENWLSSKGNSILCETERYRIRIWIILPSETSGFLHLTQKNLKHPIPQASQTHCADAPIKFSFTYSQRTLLFFFSPNNIQQSIFQKSRIFASK